MEQFNFDRVISKSRQDAFVEYLMDIQRKIGFKVSSRGWAYLLEQRRLINKDQFDKVTNVINRMRKIGKLPVDFVAEDEARGFKEVHRPEPESFDEFVESWIKAVYDCGKYYTPNWWDNEEYYIQMVVEKVDLVTLFQPICRDYHIPIGNAKGWSSISQRAIYARRFKQAEIDGKKCVLLYCGDHDPDGLRISDQLRKNLDDVKNVRWGGGGTGYDPEDLIIDRFGLDYEFIIDNDLTWIDNLITGGKKDLADPSHPNHDMAYLQNYLKKVGVRKCEANAIVAVPEMGRELCKKAIKKYLGEDALSRFEKKQERVKKEVQKYMDETGVTKKLEEAKELLKDD